MIATHELQRVLGEAPDPALPPETGLATFQAACNNDAPEVLACARDALACVLRYNDKFGADLDLWRSVLPQHFLARCGPERSDAEAVALLKLPAEERIRLPWTLSGWLYWFTSDERQWHWWDAWCESDSTITVEVEPVDWPFAHGALEWLFLASGARGIEEQELDEY